MSTNQNHIMTRRAFTKTGGAVVAGLAAAKFAPGKALAIDGPLKTAVFPPQIQWMQSARVFLVDPYGYPFTPDIEFDARALAATMVDTHANVVRLMALGTFAWIRGVRFTRNPKLGERDLLAEVIAECKPRGIRVVPYISTGNSLAWSIVERDYPEYAQVTQPGGGPYRMPYGTDEDHGTVCWNTPYRQAYLDLIEHVVRDYDIDGIYFDSWICFYSWPSPATCYCDGCRKGFAASTGLEIPYRERPTDYTTAEQATIRRYHAWCQDQMVDVLKQVRQIIKRHKDVPLVYNINNARRLTGEDPRVLSCHDAFLYEKSHSLLQRAEGVSLARAAGLAVWPYCSAGVSGRVTTGGLHAQQDLFVTAMFGGGPIVFQSYQFTRPSNDRDILRRPFSIMARHERCFQGVENHPHVAVVWSAEDAADPDHPVEPSVTQVQSSSLGAFAACLHRHIQVTSALPDLLDDPKKLNRYKVLYLADVPHLSSQQIKNVKAFVAAGGGLIASHGASLYRPVGQPRQVPHHLFRSGFPLSPPKLVRQERFDLEELLHVRLEPLSEERAQLIRTHSSPHSQGYFQDLYLRERAASDLPGAAALNGKLIPLWCYQTVAPLGDAVVAADVVAGEDTILFPGIVLSRHGKGRVAYIAPALEGLYLQTNLPEMADVLRSVIEWTSPEPVPYTIDAPECLIANLTSGGDERVLHLVNWTGNKFERAGVNESYLASIENVRVRLRKPAGRNIGQVTLFVDAPFTRKDVGDSLEITLPRAEAYQGIRFVLS